MSRLRKCLSGLPDLERGITRILHKTASPAELLQTLRAFANLASLNLQVTTVQSLFLRCGSGENKKDQAESFIFEGYAYI